MRLLISFPLLLITVALYPQGNTGQKDYQPEQGQEGKDVRWFPTPQTLVDRMLDMAKVTPADYLVDLGSGEGRIVITAAKRGLHATGIEYDHNLVELSKKNAVKEGVSDKVRFIEGDLFKFDFSKATVITMFLLPEINLQLRPRLLELKPGTRIISTTFTMQDWQHDDMVKIYDNTSKWTTAYLWIIPAKVTGTWKFEGGELRLTQKFQTVSGEMVREGKTIKISSGKLRGYEFTFTAGGTLYTCRTEGNSMNGTAAGSGKITAWAARKIK